MKIMDFKSSYFIGSLIQKKIMDQTSKLHKNPHKYKSLKKQQNLNLIGTKKKMHHNHIKFTKEA